MNVPPLPALHAVCQRSLRFDMEGETGGPSGRTGSESADPTFHWLRVTKHGDVVICGAVKASRASVWSLTLARLAETWEGPDAGRLGTVARLGVL